MFKFMIIGWCILIFSFVMIKNILIIRKNSLEGKHPMDGLKSRELSSNADSLRNSEIAGSVTSNRTGLNSLANLELTGSIPTNSTGLNPRSHHFHWKFFKTVTNIKATLTSGFFISHAKRYQKKLRQNDTIYSHF